MTTNEQNNFRQTRKWRNFRQELLDARGYRCELCGTIFCKSQKGKLQIHHIDPQHYDNLDPDKFKILDARCHEMVEKINKKIHAKKYNLLRKDDWVQLLKDFLPIS